MKNRVERMVSWRGIALPLALALVCGLTSTAGAEAQFWKKDKDKKADGQTAKKSKKSGDTRCEDVGLVWNLDDEYSDLDAVELTGISSLPIEVGGFMDRRQADDPREIGRNVEDLDDDDDDDDSGGRILYVTTDDDIAAFVAEQTAEVLHKLGYNVVGGGAGKVIITGEVRDFHVTEDNTYEGEVRLLLKVSDRSGKVLYEGTHGGTEGSFGRSYNCDNYFEVLSDSLLEAVHSMAVKDAFYKALKKVAG